MAKPSNLIYAKYVPGYDIISELSMNLLGMKPDVFLSIGLYFYVGKRIISGASEFISTLGARYFMSTIVIECSDDLYFFVLNWLTEEPVVQDSRFLQAKATSAVPWNMQSKFEPTGDSDSGHWELKVPPTYEPDYRTYCYWKGWRPIWISRNKDRSSIAAVYRREDVISLACIG